MACCKSKAGVSSEPPRDTLTPPKETLELERDEFGIDVNDAPEPENSVAVAVPVIVTPPVTVSNFLLLS